MALLSKAQWLALKRLYVAGRQGIETGGRSYDSAGPWAALMALRDHDPPLAREVFRLDPANRTTHFLVMITDAGERFFERHRRLYDTLYPPG